MIRSFAIRVASLCFVLALGAVIVADVPSPLKAQSPAVQAPADDKTPKLSDVQRLTLQNAYQRVQIAQLEFEKVIASLQIEGYDFDLNSGTYKKKPDKK